MWSRYHVAQRSIKVGEAGATADKAMQIHSGTLMKIKLSKAAKEEAFYGNEQLYSSSLRLV